MLRTFQVDRLDEEIAHYILRARQERELSAKAINADLARAHLDRATRYEKMIAQTHTPGDGYRNARDESSNFVMTSQGLFPFHVRRTGRLATALPL